MEATRLGICNLWILWDFCQYVFVLSRIGPHTPHQWRHPDAGYTALCWNIRPYSLESHTPSLVSDWHNHRRVGKHLAHGWQRGPLQQPNAQRRSVCGDQRLVLRDLLGAREKIAHLYKPITINKITFTFGTLYMLPVGGWALYNTNFAAFTPSISAKVVYILFFTSFLVYLLNSYAVKKRDPPWRDFTFICSLFWPQSLQCFSAPIALR